MVEWRGEGWGDDILAKWWEKRREAGYKSMV